MHARHAILAQIRTLLGTATSPALPVYEADETAAAAPCWQIAEGTEVRGVGSTQIDYERLIGVRVTARARDMAERDAMSEALEAVLLGPGGAGSFELEWVSADLSLPREQVGERTYPATYELLVHYYSSRNP